MVASPYPWHHVCASGVNRGLRKDDARPPRTPPLDTLTPAERALAGAIDPARLERDLAALLRIPSVTGDEAGIQDAVAELLLEAGLAVTRLEPDPTAVASDPDFPGSEVERTRLPIVFGRIGRAGGRRVLLVGHVDVVPVGDVSLWRTPPWQPTVVGDAMYGRGAVDMKGGLVAAIGAVRALAASGTALAGQVLLVAVPSEEDGGQGMLAAIRAGATGDVAVIAEPSGLDIVTAHAGALTFRLTVTGKAAHASMRREGVSALDKLGVLTAALASDETTRNAAETHPRMVDLGLPYPTIIGKVQGGEWASTVMDRLVAEGRYGVRLGQTAAAAEAELRTCIERACAADDWLRDHPAAIDIVGGRFASAEVPDDHPLPQALAATIEAVVGRRPAFLGKPYGADMRLLVHEGRTPTVIFGPGDVAVAHAPNEHVPLSEVAACARSLAVWLLREIGTRS